MNRHVDLISERQVAKEAIFRLVEAHLRYERFDGTMSDELVRISFERGDSAAVVLHDQEDDTVVLVEQFRYPTLKTGTGWMLELPAGIIQTSQSGEGEVTVRRELLEETGYEAGALTHVFTFYLSPGASSERLFLYYGSLRTTRSIAPGGGVRHEGEDIRTVFMRLDDALSKIGTGEIADAKTIIALQWLKLSSLSGEFIQLKASERPQTEQGGGAGHDASRRKDSDRRSSSKSTPRRRRTPPTTRSVDP
jgi:ADP-ribose diphosphatase